MSAELAQAIRQLVQDRGISEDLVMKTVEDVLLAAYKRKFGTTENCVIRFGDDGDDVTVFAQKTIVEEDEFEDPVMEIPLDEALAFNAGAELGDELMIEINPRDFDRVSIQSAKQKARQTLREIQKDTLYSEFQDKVGELIIGYYQRERNGAIFVDLGKTEGILPRKYQSPREDYRANDRIRALIQEVEKTPMGLQIILSRTHTEFVKKIFELEVPEIYDRTIEIYKMVREAGYRTKMAVYSTREDVDPVGACVGMRGVRIQAVVRELEGEKIDVLKYDPDPRAFIRNALQPAEVSQVIILDEPKRQALAVVPENQFSLAIGKQGLNVRLANRLVDWNIDVRTRGQAQELGIGTETQRAVSALFSDVVTEEITHVAELPGLPQGIAEVLLERGIEFIETLISLSADDLRQIDGLSEEDVVTLTKLLEETVEVVEETVPVAAVAEMPIAAAAPTETEPAPVEEEEEEAYECPECGHEVEPGMAQCPNCGVGLSFEEAEDEE